MGIVFKHARGTTGLSTGFV